MTSFPLIAAQRGIYVADQLSEFSNAYVIVHFLDIRGDVNLDALTEAIIEGMNEFDTLRMVYTTDRRGDPIQVLKDIDILPQPEFLDLRNFPCPVDESKRIMGEDMQSPCRVGSGSDLIRHIIMRLADNEYRWYQRFHHIQLDAYSFTALTRRIGAIYSMKIHGLTVSEPLTLNGSSAPRGFEEVVQEYENYRISPKFVKDAEFWRSYCSELPDAASVCPLPLAGVLPSKHIIRNQTILDGSKVNKIISDCTSIEKKLANVDIVLALISVWLMRLCNKDSLTTGFIFMRRLGSAAINTSGPFINVLPLPINMDSRLSAIAVKLASNLRSIRKHQKYDSEDIVRESGHTWDNNPLFGPVINLKAFDYKLDFANLETVTHHVASGPIRDLELALYIDAEGSVKVEYLANSSRYTSEQLDHHLERLHILLNQFSENSEADCFKANVMLPAEIDELNEVNSTQKQLQYPYYSESHCLMDLVLHSAVTSPDRIALSDDSAEFKEGLSYQQMLSEVVVLSELLIQTGVNAGDIVAVAMPRSVYLSLAIQAISLIGATWLPLDPSYPAHRLELMISDAKPVLLVSNNEVNTSAFVKETNIPTLEYNNLFAKDDDQDVAFSKAKLLVNRANSASSAYIIYTSGSTGMPKGVIVGQLAIVNRLLWMRDEFKITRNDAILQKTSACFDVSVWEFFLPLISGSKLVMAPQDAHRDPLELKRLIITHGITTLHFVPSMLSTFLSNSNLSEPEHEVEWIKNLNRVFCSGEALTVKTANLWEKLTAVSLYNLYGPTEAAIDVTFSPANGTKNFVDEDLYIPIGFPVWNTQMHVLDSRYQLVPKGVSGDLYISGIQLAHGYLNRPVLTEERFSTIEGVRMYRTGDIARWSFHKNGLEFLGRSDDQVKLRGQRIELGEIDSLLESLPSVQQAVTLALQNPNISTTDGDSRQLVSYIVGTAEPQTVRKDLSAKLPSYMVPVKVIVVDELPISASGKLDKRSLPSAFDQSDSASEVKKTEPKEGIEKKIAQAFEQIIGCQKVYAEDDFFSLGGHSLMAVKLATNLRTILDLPITIGQVMQYPRVKDLAAELSDESNIENWGNAGFQDVMPLTPGQQSVTPQQTLYCIHPASGFSWQFSVLSRYLDPAKWNVVGIQSASLEGPLATNQTLSGVVDAHFETLLRIHHPNKPYYLLGYSLGGTLAHSLAAKLESVGRDVRFLGLLDTWPPETQNWNAKRQRKEVDQAVVDEMNREREQFLSASSNNDDTSERMFGIIQSNYASAVNILATASSSRFNGVTTLFVAEKTLPANTDLQEVWKSYSAYLQTEFVDSSHVDIVSPKVFKQLGPLLDAKLGSVTDE